MHGLVINRACRMASRVMILNPGNKSFLSHPKAPKKVGSVTAETVVKSIERTTALKERLGGPELPSGMRLHGGEVLSVCGTLR